MSGSGKPSVSAAAPGASSQEALKTASRIMAEALEALLNQESAEEEKSEETRLPEKTPENPEGKVLSTQYDPETEASVHRFIDFQWFPRDQVPANLFALRLRDAALKVKHPSCTLGNLIYLWTCLSGLRHFVSEGTKEDPAFQLKCAVERKLECAIEQFLEQRCKPEEFLRFMEVKCQWTTVLPLVDALNYVKQALLSGSIVGPEKSMLPLLESLIFTLNKKVFDTGFLNSVVLQLKGLQLGMVDRGVCRDYLWVSVQQFLEENKRVISAEVKEEILTADAPVMIPSSMLPAAPVPAAPTPAAPLSVSDPALSFSSTFELVSALNQYLNEEEAAERIMVARMLISNLEKLLGESSSVMGTGSALEIANKLQDLKLGNARDIDPRHALRKPIVEFMNTHPKMLTCTSTAQLFDRVSEPPAPVPVSLPSDPALSNLFRAFYDYLKHANPDHSATIDAVNYLLGKLENLSNLGDWTEISERFTMLNLSNLSSTDLSRRILRKHVLIALENFNRMYADAAALIKIEEILGKVSTEENLVAVLYSYIQVENEDIPDSEDFTKAAKPLIDELEKLIENKGPVSWGGVVCFLKELRLINVFTSDHYYYRLAALVRAFMELHAKTFKRLDVKISEVLSVMPDETYQLFLALDDFLKKVTRNKSSLRKHSSPVGAMDLMWMFRLSLVDYERVALDLKKLKLDSLHCQSATDLRYPLQNPILAFMTAHPEIKEYVSIREVFGTNQVQVVADLIAALKKYGQENEACDTEEMPREGLCTLIAYLETDFLFPSQKKVYWEIIASCLRRLKLTNAMSETDPCYPLLKPVQAFIMQYPEIGSYAEPLIKEIIDMTKIVPVVPVVPVAQVFAPVTEVVTSIIPLKEAAVELAMALLAVSDDINAKGGKDVREAVAALVPDLFDGEILRMGWGTMDVSLSLILGVTKGEALKTAIQTLLYSLKQTYPESMRVFFNLEQRGFIGPNSGYVQIAAVAPD